jgi:gamma-butyrobetaine dioxygenase
VYGPHDAAKSQQFRLQKANQRQEPPVVSKPLDWPDPLWLRDACSCELCVDPSSKQKRFQTSDIPLEVNYLAKDVGPDGSLSVTWSNDIQGFGSAHVSTYTKDFLSLYGSSKSAAFRYSRHKAMKLWDKAMITESVKFIDFSHYISQDSVLDDVLGQLREYGLVFLCNVPESEKAIEDIAGRIGPLKNTFYGLTWDVKSVPEAKNVAYTHQYLGLHMDLLYTDSPPSLQLLHCLKNTCEGGNSLFRDSYQAAAQLKEENREAFYHLGRQKTSFVYDNAGENYSQQRFVISPEWDRGIKNVNWSPPFQGPFHIKGGIFSSNGVSTFRSYTAALKEFAARIEATKNIYEYRLKEGECVIFDNRRVLHARRAFDINSGERWLKGAYLDADVWRSRQRVVDRMLGPAAAVPLQS